MIYLTIYECSEENIDSFCNFLQFTESLNLTRQFENYSYLNQSGCTSVSSINDQENYKIVEVGILFSCASIFGWF